MKKCIIEAFVTKKKRLQKALKVDKKVKCGAQ